MFGKKKNNQPRRGSVRSRQPNNTVTEAFRRNTVVISKSQREVAAYRQSVTQRQADLKRQRAIRKTKIRMVTIGVSLALILLGLRMVISGVQLSSNASSHLSASDIQSYNLAILRSFRSHTIGGQSWLADTSGVRKDIMQQFPEIGSINFDSNTPLSTMLKVNIRFRTAVFVWKDASGSTQFVDENGVLFSKNLDPAVNVKKLVSIEDQSGVVLKAGTSVLTSQLVQFVGQLHAKVPAAYPSGTSLTKVIIPRSTREVQVRVSEQAYYIKFSSAQSLDAQIGDLKVLLGYFAEHKTAPKEYIDLRVPGKAFYK